jgi:hypothetical protein
MGTIPGSPINFKGSTSEGVQVGRNITEVPVPGNRHVATCGLKRRLRLATPTEPSSAAPHAAPVADYVDAFESHLRRYR